MLADVLQRAARSVAVRAAIGAGVTVLAIVMAGPLNANDGGPRQPTFCLLAVGGFLAAGLVSMARRPRDRVGWLLVLTAMLLALQFGAANRDDPVRLAIGLGALGTAAATAMAAVVAAVRPAARAWPGRVLTIAAVVATVGLRVPDALTFAPGDDPFFAATETRNPLFVDNPPAGLAQILRSSGWIVLTLFVLATLWLLARAATAERRPRASLLIAAAGAAAMAIESGVSQLLPSHRVRDGFADLLWPLNLPEAALLVIAPALLVTAQLSTRLTRPTVQRMLMDLRSAHVPGATRDALATAVGDPRLRLGIWTGTAYVDSDGAPFAPAAEHEVATAIDDDEGPLALLVHDRSALDDPGLVDAVAGAARLALERERLQAEVRAQLLDVRASRARTVAAADAERRRIERDLHDGAQQRLVTIAVALQMARLSLPDTDDRVLRVFEEAATETQLAIDELRDLSRGIFPPVLADEGLDAALRTLGERAPGRVVVEGAVRARLPDSVEAAAYFLCHESLAAAARAGASCATVVVASDHDEITLALKLGVAPTGDDLLALRDRVEAIGGELEATYAGLHARLPAGKPMAVDA